MKVPRRIVAIEIRQGTFQISRKIDVSICDKIAPLLTISSALVLSEFESEHIRKSWFPQEFFQTPIPQATELFFQPVIVVFLWLVESALISSAG